MANNGSGRRDIIVVGASAGGVEALERLVRGLPADLPASVLVVLHRPPDYESVLPQILARAGRLPVANAWDGERPQHGRIYIAPPDRHLLIEEGVMRLVRGPRENHSRPAIDPLFRTAALEFGPRVAGVILSGTLFDGTAGLFAVKRRGGVAIVQDPNEAAFPAMPESAIGNVAVDYVLPVADIASLLARLAGEPSQDRAGRQDEHDEVITAMSPQGSEFDLSSGRSEFEELPEIVRHDQDEQMHGARHGRPTLYTCPECGGTLWQASAGPLLQFRCHVGHAYTGEGMVREQAETLERSLWYSIRLLADKALLLRQLADNARQRGDEDVARQFEQKAREADEHGQTLRQVVQADGAGNVPAS